MATKWLILEIVRRVRVYLPPGSVGGGAHTLAVFPKGTLGKSLQVKIGGDE